MSTRDKEEIDEQAIQWFVLLRDEDATDDTRRDFEAWMAADAEHAKAWHEVVRLWDGLDQIGHEGGALAVTPGPHAASPEVQPAPPTPPRADAAASNIVALDVAGKARRPRRPHPWLGAAIAASLLVVVTASWSLAPVGLFADYRSGVGERRTVELEDGSRVELATESALDVNYSDGQRSVTLVAGEAFFTVAADPDRPFVVSAGAGEIVVLGTAFNVRLGDETTVAVSEHVVAVHAADSNARVSEGELVHFGSEGISPVEAADLEQITAWRNDQIVFRNAPLGQVVRELQRYRRGRIQILGADLAEKRVTAVFDTRSVDDALNTIANSLGLRLVDIGGLFTALVSG